MSYLYYKQKYLHIKKQIGGNLHIEYKKKYDDSISYLKQNNFPSENLITNEFILSIKDNEEYIYNISNVFFYMNDIDSIDELSFVYEMALNFINDFENNSIIIAPGDSPSRIVILIDFFYKKKSIDEYFDLYEYKYKNITKQKNLKIINFPISGVNDGIDKKKFSDYLKKDVLKSIEKYDKFGFFDYISSGNTLKIFKDFFKNEKKEIKIYKIDYPYTLLFKFFLIESTYRCQKRYEVNESKYSNIDYLGCNVNMCVLFLYKNNILFNNNYKNINIIDGVCNLKYNIDTLNGYLHSYIHDNNDEIILINNNFYDNDNISTTHRLYKNLIYTIDYFDIIDKTCSVNNVNVQTILKKIKIKDDGDYHNFIKTYKPETEKIYRIITNNDIQIEHVYIEYMVKNVLYCLIKYIDIYYFPHLIPLIYIKNIIILE